MLCMLRHALHAAPCCCDGHPGRVSFDTIAGMFPTMYALHCSLPCFEVYGFGLENSGVEVHLSVKC